MAEQKKKTNTNNKKNTTKKVNNASKTNTSKKVVKKVTPKKEEIKVEKVTEEVVTPVVKEKKTFKLTSSQRDLILVLLVAVVLVIALVLTGGKKLDIELPLALEGEAGFTEITYSEYAEKLDMEKPFVVVIKRDGCGYCDMYEPVVTEVANEYGLPIYYINMSKLNGDEQKALSSSNSYLRKNQWGTPTTLFMYGKTVVDTIGGYVEKDELVEFVKENFVIGE